MIQPYKTWFKCMAGTEDNKLRGDRVHLELALGGKGGVDRKQKAKRKALVIL